jgi:quercetin dioxygenase-like cupin family protein
MIRSPYLCLLLVVAIAATFLAPFSGVAQQDDLPSELAGLASGGVTVDLLAQEVFPDFENAMSLRLERLVPAPVADQIANALGPELWYVEAGTLVLAVDGGEARTVQAGEQTLIAGTGSISYRVEGSDCPSVLRLALTTGFAMDVGSDLAGPVLNTETPTCPPGGVLFRSSGELLVPTGPTLAFVSRMTFPVVDFPEPRTFTGPIGYAPETGLLEVGVASSANVLVAPGSWIAVNGNAPHGVSARGGAPATALVAGLIASEEPAPPTPTVAAGVQGTTYVSPTFGYSLSWDETWTVVGETSLDGSDILQLNNGVSDVYFQSYGNYTGDPAACVASIAEQLPNNEGWANVEPMRTASGDPIAGSDATRAYAVYTFNYTAEGTTTEFVEYLECRAIVPGQSILVITQLAPRDAYPGQVEPMRLLLEGLVMP